jgi:hypothetical protein
MISRTRQRRSAVRVGKKNEEESMKTSIKLSAAVGALSVLLTGLAFAYQFNFGALVTDASWNERVAFGNPPGGFSFSRTQILVPVDYGRLVAITQSAGAAVFWYESQDGTVRNVAINATGPVVINRKGNLN